MARHKSITDDDIEAHIEAFKAGNYRSLRSYYEQNNITIAYSSLRAGMIKVGFTDFKCKAKPPPPCPHRETKPKKPSPIVDAELRNSKSRTNKNIAPSIFDNPDFEIKIHRPSESPIYVIPSKSQLSTQQVADIFDIDPSYVRPFLRCFGITPSTCFDPSVYKDIETYSRDTVSELLKTKQNFIEWKNSNN